MIQARTSGSGRTLVGAAARKRIELKLGRKVPKRSPKRFVADVERGWRKHVQAG